MAGQVELDGHSYPLVPGERFTFGRSHDCTARLAIGDAAISRVAGSLCDEGGTWWLSNDSGRRLFAVVDEFGFRSVVPPGRRVAVEAPVRVVLDGAAGTYSLQVTVPRKDQVVVAAVVGTSTSAGEGVVVNSADRLAMVALFAGYLEDPPRHDPYPKSYGAAAARLDWPRTTLVKRIEHLRTRLTNAGVPNLTGWNALTNLAEYAIATRLVTKEDLHLLRR
ncbi:hypothetical protein FF36_02657 [Frankia torreyi]|uniref:FHA domain-containing protein n=1 Tax=Frankia torreyi TaxID=1856 RepID=A0A0D8BG63_9ACTN|nr:MULTISPECIES: hypothetical protein [Frankia]KJE23055.1 hypothetical protein FF36_02657 [Frankia torreyi]KQM05218.1 hypothetical protein FF86_101859 [Frankia sp. CpI1-P]